MNTMSTDTPPHSSAPSGAESENTDATQGHPLAAVGVAVAAGWVLTKVVRWLVRRK